MKLAQKELEPMIPDTIINILPEDFPEIIIDSQEEVYDKYEKEKLTQEELDYIEDVPERCRLRRYHKTAHPDGNYINSIGQPCICPRNMSKSLYEYNPRCRFCIEYFIEAPYINIVTKTIEIPSSYRNKVVTEGPLLLEFYDLYGADISLFPKDCLKFEDESKHQLFIEKMTNVDDKDFVIYYPLYVYIFYSDSESHISKRYFSWTKKKLGYEHRFSGLGLF